MTGRSCLAVCPHLAGGTPARSRWWGTPARSSQAGTPTLPPPVRPRRGGTLLRGILLGGTPPQVLPCPPVLRYPLSDLVGGLPCQGYPPRGPPVRPGQGDPCPGGFNARGGTPPWVPPGQF